MELGELADLLNLLKRQDILFFEGLGIKVQFSPTTQEIQSIPQSSSKPAAPKSMWDHPSLWPGGEPPSFPK